MGQYDLSSNLYEPSTLLAHRWKVMKACCRQISGLCATNYRHRADQRESNCGQNGRVLYQTTVAPGPFTISDWGNRFRGSWMSQWKKKMAAQHLPGWLRIHSLFNP